MASVHVPNFREKLRLIFDHHSLVKDRTQLAAALQLRPNTISEWLGGAKTGCIDAVPERHIAAFGGLVSTIANCELEIGKKLFLGPVEQFRTAVNTVAPTSLMEVLRRRSADLAVTFERCPRGAIGAVRGSIKPTGSIVRLQRTEEIVLCISADVGKSLIALCADRTGVWRLLAPGPFHDGLVAANPFLFPQRGVETIAFEDNGPHHFVFIELARHLIPALPAMPVATDCAALDGSYCSRLASDLLLPSWSHEWRWAEALFDVVD